MMRRASSSGTTVWPNGPTGALIEASSGNIGIYRGIPIAYGQSSPELP
jgi:hypothetical protein